MKVKAIGVGAAAVIGVLVVLAVAMRKPDADVSGPDSAAGPRSPAAVETPVSHISVDAAVRGIPETVESAEEAASVLERNSLGISAAYLEEGIRRADILAVNYRETLSADRGYYQDMFMTEDKYPIQKLARRLGLDENDVEKLSAIMTAHAEAEMQRYADAEMGEIERLRNLLDSDYEGYVNYLALKEMSARGEELTREQSTHYQKFKELIYPDGMSVVPWKMEAWHESSEVMQAIKGALPPNQWDNVLLYVEEQALRDVDTQAYMRSTQLADTLGLDEVDRTALYKFLQENPDISNRELSEQLSPELRALMPAD